MEIKYLLIPLLLLGCTATTPVCPTCPVCTACNCPTATPVEADNWLYVYFIDVGQGDATLIKYHDTEALIDCGKETKGHFVTEFLDSKKVGQLEYIFTTHPDSDHIGGCAEVMKQFKTTTVVTNGEQQDSYVYKEFMAEAEKAQVIRARVGNSWTIGPATLEALHSNEDKDDSNQNSLVLKLTYENFGALFPGDCDNGCEEELLNKTIKVKVLHVAHHGSKFGTNIDFLELVHPEVAVISVGDDNQYGHPAEETLDRLSQENVIVYRTDSLGDVSFKTDGMSYEKI